MLLALIAAVAIAQSPAAPSPSVEGKGAAAVTAPAPTTSPAPATPQPGGGDSDSPPPGAPEDQALWREAYRVNNEILVERSVAVQAQWRAHNGAYDRRLARLAAGEGPASAEAARLRTEVVERWDATSAVVSSPWPVDPTRACRQELLHLDSSMRSAIPADLPEARSNLRTCVEKAQAVLARLVPASRALEETLAEADRLLASSPPAPVPPTAPVPPAAPVPPSAPAAPATPGPAAG
jgi:hypothetical protein